jgi:hypothetical protein
MFLQMQRRLTKNSNRQTIVALVPMYLFSVTDAETVLAAAGYRLSARQVRYAGLRPAQRGLAQNGARLFDEVDVAMLAVLADLLARCRRLGLPAWLGRAAVRYRERELRRALERKKLRFLVVDPATGTAILSETADVRGTAIDLGTLRMRISTAVVAHRRTYPEVWTGAAYEDQDGGRM